jgi:hypothetical protein
MNDIKQISTREITSADFQITDAVLRQNDYLVRITSDLTTDAFKVAWAPTNHVKDAFQAILSAKDEDVRALRNVVQWQHRLINFNAHYTAFLLEQTSEEEFGEVAESFAYDPHPVPADALAPLIERVLGLTEIEYTPSEFADLFQCNHEDVIDAYHLLVVNKPMLKTMLPVDPE